MKQEICSLGASRNDYNTDDYTIHDSTIYGANNNGNNNYRETDNYGSWIVCDRMEIVVWSCCCQLLSSQPVLDFLSICCSFLLLVSRS